MTKIPVSVLITTRNEERHMARCLAALERFDEVVVIDSQSTDSTCAIAQSFGARIESFDWNGRYPKKRQWALDHLSLKHDRIFFVDADEELTPILCDEIAALDWRCAGYFIKGLYVASGRVLRFGDWNSKLALFDRTKIAFPVVDDLDVPGMGEIEGHYQPVLKPDFRGERIGRLKSSLLHHALEDADRWQARHAGYAQWRRGVEGHLPPDPLLWRRLAKAVWRRMPLKTFFYLVLFYGVRMGVLEAWHNQPLVQAKLDYFDRSKNG